MWHLRHLILLALTIPASTTTQIAELTFDAKICEVKVEVGPHFQCRGSNREHMSCSGILVTVKDNACMQWEIRHE